MPAHNAHIAAHPAEHAIEVLQALTWRTLQMRYTREGAVLEGVRGRETATLTAPITSKCDMSEALIIHGIYDDPIWVALDVMAEMDRIGRAMGGEHVEPRVVKEVELPGDAERESRIGIDALHKGAAGNHENALEKIAQAEGRETCERRVRRARAQHPDPNTIGRCVDSAAQGERLAEHAESIRLAHGSRARGEVRTAVRSPRDASETSGAGTHRAEREKHDVDGTPTAPRSRKNNDPEGR